MAELATGINTSLTLKIFKNCIENKNFHFLIMGFAPSRYRRFPSAIALILASAVRGTTREKD